MSLNRLPVPDGLLAFGRRHPALLVTLGYLTISVVGLMFSWEYYRRFGINYFVFAEIGDFLLAVMREPMSLVAAAIGITVIILMYAYGNWEIRKLSARPNPGRGLRGYLRVQRFFIGSPTLLVLILLMYMLLFIGLWAENRAAAVKSGDATNVMLTLSGSEPAAFVLIGSSGRFLFVYDSVAQMPIVVPNDAIVSVAFPGQVVPEPPPEQVSEVETTE